MKTFTIDTLGCKVNQYETQQIRQLLQSHGLNPVSAGSKADLVVINTCCVTHIASSKSRQSIRKAQKNSPKATIVVAGCLPAAQTDELNNIGSNLHIVRKKDDLAATLAALERHSAPAEPKLTPLTAFSGQTRAFLKIQDGCDGCCTYCIVPKIRTNVCNKDAKIVIEEAKALAKAGHKEIVLTGVFVGAYGQNTVVRKNWDPARRDTLPSLLEKLVHVPNLARIRLSSLEVGDVTEKLLDVMTRYDNIMPHLHLPLQSGSDRILTRMRRQYRKNDFISAVEQLKTRLDRPAITTDIIVGFPGETDEDFEETMTLARQVQFSKVHVFSYSPRKGTPAAIMPNQINPEVIKKRSQKLRNLDKKLQKDFRNSFKGQKVEIITESTNPTTGRTKRYFKAELTNQKQAKPGDLVTGILD